MLCDRIINSRFLTKLLTVFGLWPVARNTTTFFVRYYRFYQYLLNITLTFNFTLLLWIEIILCGDVDYAFQWLRVVITETCLVIKIFNIWHYAQTANDLLHEWDKSDMFSLKTLAEEKMWQGAQRSFQKVLLAYSTICICSTLLIMCSVFFMETIIPPIPYWMPARWRVSNAWPVFLYEYVVVPFSCICNFQLDLMLCYLMFHLALCLRLIGTRMERLGVQINDVDITRELESIIKLHQRVKW